MRSNAVKGKNNIRFLYFDIMYLNFDEYLLKAALLNINVGINAGLLCT